MTSLRNQQQQTQAAATFDKDVSSRQLSVHFWSISFLRSSIVLGRMQSPAGGAGLAGGGVHIQWSVGEMIWTRSELTAIYNKHRFPLHVAFHNVREYPRQFGRGAINE